MDVKRIDFHVHAKPSKRFPFSLPYFRLTIDQARKVGLDAFVVTEHFHAPDFWAGYQVLCQAMRYEHGVFTLSDGFQILTGAELGVAEGCDLLLLGTLDQLSGFSQGLAASPVTGYKPRFGEAIAVARRSGLFVTGAHMFRKGKELAKLGPAVRELDALELNGKDFFLDEAVRAEASRLGIPVVGGSDAHVWIQVGIKATDVPVERVTPEAVAGAVARSEPAVRSLRYGPMAVKVSGAYKRLLKARRAREAAAWAAA